MNPTETDDAEIRKTVNKVSRKRPPKPKGVAVKEVSISAAVKRAAMLRLKRVNDYERSTEGRKVTSLGDVARRALAYWEMPDGVDAVQNAAARLARPVVERKIFRLQILEADWNAARDRIKRSGGSVAQVIQDGLAHFARTGEMPVPPPPGAPPVFRID